jgi:hypothetical protein
MIDKFSSWSNIISELEYEVAIKKLDKLESLELFSSKLNKLLHEVRKNNPTQRWNLDRNS